MQPKAFINWSGGKDCALALHKLLQSNKYNISCLVTNINSVHNRISMHGVRKCLLQAQSASINISLQTVQLPEQPSMAQYEHIFSHQLKKLKQNGYNTAIFGDIFLEDLKKYREQKLAEQGFDCVFPLWKMDTKKLVYEFIASGFKAIIVCVNEVFLDKNFCGRFIDESFIHDLPDRVDACGENGEFHTFVFGGPIFKNQLNFNIGEIVYKEYTAPVVKTNATINKYGFYFCDLMPA